MSIGMVNFKESNNVRSEYSPLNAPSQKEYAVAKSFLKQNGTMDPCYVMTHARDGGSLLRDDYRWLIYNLTRALQADVTVERNGRTYGFTDLCEPYCELNTAFLAFLKLYDENNPASHTYPAIELFGTQAFIGNNVYGVTLKKDTDQLESFSTAVLPFYLVAEWEDVDIMVEWMHAAIALFETPEYSTLLKTGMTGDNLVTYEVQRMGTETAPLIIGSFAAMIVFVVASSFRFNPVQSKPWEALIGCLIPILALVASLGVMSMLNMKFQSIVVAALFLVLSVGVDDVFIIMRAWDRSDPTSTIPERTAVTLEDAGPSITISALTNIMSFAIGASSDTPAVRTFCIYSAIAITICYFYQLILFTAIIAISGRRERRGYQSLLCCFQADPQARSYFVQKCSNFHDTVVKFWGSAVTKWPVRLTLLITMIGYFYISYIGISQMTSNISIDKMALPDSYLQDFQHTFETALRDMQPISVFVMKPGDLRDPDQLQRIKDLVIEFESATNSYGAESTFFWLRPYEDFLRFYGETDEFTYAEIPTFFKSATYFYLSSFVHYNETACLDNQPECVTSFFFITNFHEVIKYHELVPAVKHWRRIAAKFEDLKVYPYSDHTPFVDQTMSIDSTVFGSVAAALICTAVICLIFIPHVLSVVAAVFSVFSISWGIFGILSLWNVDLDPLSMAALLMAIGFSVDFTSHISFHYHKAPQQNPKKRIQFALGIIGWPMVQVGLSTIVALLPLLFKQSYLALVFLKTIIVVVILGMFHGLVVLPVVLTMITRYNPASEKSSADSSERSSQGSAERKESFYKSQNLIKSINDINWVSNGHKLRKSIKKSLSIKRVAPIRAADLANTAATPPTAMVHKIPLGRSQSNAL
uniref:SSD domain-containing protein n=1 Tax=Panagrellus redivivus TaxID=6233 RepID=A0A7E4W9R4_PANRE